MKLKAEHIARLLDSPEIESWSPAPPSRIPAGVWNSPAEPDSLPNYVAIVGRRKYTLLTLMLLGLIVAIVVSIRQTPVYRARVTLDVQPLNEEFLNARDITPTGLIGESAIEPFIQGQAERLREKALIRRVVRRFHLDEQKEFGLSTDKAVKVVLQNLNVQPIPPARMIQLTFDSKDPSTAAMVANGVADEFSRLSAEKRSERARRTNEWLGAQVAKLEASLKQSELDLQAYAQSKGLFSGNEKDSPAEEKLHVIENELARAEADRMMKEAQFDMAVQSPPETLPQAGSGTVQDYRLKLTDLRKQRAELLTILTPSNYKVQRIDAQIAELESALARENTALPERIRNEYKAATGREKLLLEAYTNQVKLASSEVVDSIHYGSLLRNLDTTRALHAALVQKVQEASWAAGMPTSNITVGIEATPPETPYKPNLPLNASLGLFAGTFLGITLIGVQELRERGFRTPGESGKVLHIPELGVIPSARVDPMMRRSGFLPSGLQPLLPVERVTHEHSRSLMAEAFRGTLASLFYSQASNRARVIVFTSPGPNDGKTTVVSNLGLAVAQLNRRVLLISADLRQPRLHELFGIHSGPGLTDLLRLDQNDLAAASLDDYIQPSGIPNLAIMPSGTETGHDLVNAAALLHSDRLFELLLRLRGDFQAIFVDTPPVLQIPDARIVGKGSDGVVIVVRAGHTSKAAAIDVAHRFEADETPILGTILNDWNPRRSDSDSSQTYLSTYRYYRKSQRNT